MTASLVATVFLGSFLLFWVQPLFSKMALPLLGGSPSVWTASLVFYQAGLFAGYLQAHYMSKHLRGKPLTWTYLSVLALAGAVLPVTVRLTDSPLLQSHPALWMSLTLFVSVGLPFFVLASTSPFLQKQLSGTNHRYSRDPYFLYAASNAGSLLGLLLFVLLFEPLMKLSGQSWAWSGTYALFGALMAASLVLLSRAQKALPEPKQEAQPAGATMPWPSRLKVLYLSFIPSSLLYGVTTHTTLNITATPLLWIVPLVIFLLTYILAFQRKATMPRRLFSNMQLGFIMFYAIFYISTTDVNFVPLALLLPFHFLMFFFAAIVCHLALAEARPHTSSLTEFYVLISLGGLMGGVFSAVIAPLAFNSLAEYPLMLVAALAARPSQGQEISGKAFKRDLLAGALVFVVFSVMAQKLSQTPVGLELMVTRSLSVLFVLGFLFFRKRPLRVALCVGAVFLAAGLMSGNSKVLYKERTFFGIHKVAYNRQENMMVLKHGTVVHAKQSLEPGLRHEPQVYYSRTEALGRVFDEFYRQGGRGNIAAIGLGAGSTAAYSGPGQHWDYYEIDPVIISIAKNPNYFTFLSTSKAPYTIIQGDGRLQLEKAQNSKYSVIIVDAFLSDSIPVHMATLEAMGIYKDKLKPGGLLAFHVTSKYVGLLPVLYNAGRLKGLRSLYCSKKSLWIVMTEDPKALENISAEETCKEVKKAPPGLLWTDDYSSILDVLHLR